jgi:hypothetical protein
MLEILLAMAISHCISLLLLFVHTVTAIPFPSQSWNPGHDPSSSPFYCAAASWPYENIVGSEIQAQLPDVELQEILSQVSAANIEATILQLVTYGTRHTLSSQTDPIRGIGAARDWIEQEFKKYAEASEGRMTVEVVSYIQEPDGERILFPVRISDVVATLRGSEDPERIYVVSGHYDSRCLDPNDYMSDAPGADDEYGSIQSWLQKPY